MLRLVPGARHAVGVHLDRDELTAVLVDLSGGVVAGRTAPLDLGAGANAVLQAVESAVHGLIGAGLPALGVGADRLATSDGATGGELWQQASAGEVWRSRLPGGTEEGREARRGEMRQAVAEEGELWSGTGPEEGEERRDEAADAAGTDAEPPAGPEPVTGPETESGEIESGRERNPVRRSPATRSRRTFRAAGAACSAWASPRPDRWTTPAVCSTT